MGANVLKGGSLVPAWRENSIGSFIAAAATGASFVEFDVQVTRDGIPVLWHDDTVDFGDPAAPSRAPISDLTTAEFKALGSITASAAGATRLAVLRSFWEEAAPARAPSPAAAAAASPPRSRTPPRHWRCARDEGFPTLDEVFSALPSCVGFDIEVKMATPSNLAVTPPEEVSRVVDPILAAVERCCPPSVGSGDGDGDTPLQERPVVFSSFDPDACAVLRARQRRWPVLFLSTGGRDPHADARRTSLDAALGVAQLYGLAGVIVDSGALQDDTAFAARVAAAPGLKLLTYGRENDDPAWVREQAALGVHGVICDDVQAALGAAQQAAAAAATVAAAAAAASAAALEAAAAASVSVAALETAPGVSAAAARGEPLAAEAAHVAAAAARVLA